MIADHIIAGYYKPASGAGPIKKADFLDNLAQTAFAPGVYELSEITQTPF
jgi:hypothetical protein